MLNVRIGDVLLEGLPRNEDSAYVISPDGFVGWDDATEIRRTETLRPVAHGSFDVRGFQSARVVTVSGYILARTPAELRSMASRLRGVLADGSSGRVSVDTSEGTSWADVRLAGKTTVDVLGVSGRDAEFSLSFWSADPRRFGESREFEGPSAVAYHLGNFPAAPILEVRGTLPSGWSVDGPDGRVFQTSQALTAGQVHRVDMAAGRLTRDGVVQVGVVTSGETWAVPPGASVTHAFTPTSGTGSLSVIVTDTFI